MEVTWSSKIEKGWFFWKWTCTIYKGGFDQRITNHGANLSFKYAVYQRDQWLKKMGETS